MANIKNELNNIKNALYGKDVRNSIHNAIKQCYDDASINNNANMEVRLARGTHNTLNDRLSESDKKQEKLSSQLEYEAINLQGQINNLVINGTGDSNPEVVQARGSYNLLNDRLNESDDKVERLIESVYVCEEEIDKIKEDIGYDTKNITLEENSTYIIPSNCETQTITLTWDGGVADGDSSYFFNGASGTLPHKMGTVYTQVMDTWGKDVGAYAYDNKGEDTYGQAYGYIYINVANGDTITCQSDYFYDSEGLKISEISTTGIYAMKISTIMSNTSFVNRGFLKSTNGESIIESVVLQSLPWIRNNHPKLSVKSIQDFIKYFPPSKIGRLDFGSSYTPIKQASALINGNVVDSNTTMYQIQANMNIECTFGSLSFKYKIAKGTETDGVQTKPFANYKWACIGDSYTDTTVNANYKYEQIIHDLTGIQVQMLGVGGTGWWKGYDTESSYRFRASQVDIDTDVVTVFGSINDWKYYQGDNPLTLGDKTDTLANNKHTLCAYINDVFDALEDRVPTAQIIVFSPMYYHGLSNRVKELFDTVKMCTEHRGYEYVDMLNIGWLRIQNNVEYAKKYCTDYSETSETFGHPNNLAHKTFIAPKFYNKLKEYLPISKGL